MPRNRATIYSNGIADFQRVFSVSGSKPNKISLPIRQQHLADVLASLTVTGDVSIAGPPSFQPANQDDGNIVISTQNSLTELAKQLSGAEIEITVAKKTISGTLVGIQDHEIAGAGEPITESSLVVLCEGAFHSTPIRQIENFRFLEKTIQSEITKALNRRLRNIKPNSTFVELELSTSKKKTDAIIQYTIPAAAWKISYRIIIHEDDEIELQGHAIVDNNTDEDWDEFMIAVVMGQPITFSTDLAESKSPDRNHVNVVPDTALGSVVVETAIDGLSMDMMEVEAAPMVGAKRRSRNFAPASALRKSSLARDASAEIEASDVTETGDFCIFESANPVSIDARRSSIIPVFQTTLKLSRSVLHYKHKNHAQRPYRAIDFKNGTEHSLGHGVCTVYDLATYAGSCIIPALPTGGDALLPHALETAVRVHYHPQKIESRRIGIRIAEGVANESYHKLKRTEYVINNNRDQSFSFVFDHDVWLQSAKCTCQLLRESAEPIELESEMLSQGRRVRFDLLERDVVKIVFVETTVSKTQVHLIGDDSQPDHFNLKWLHENLIESNSSLLQDPAILHCIELQRVLDEKNDQIQHVQEEFQRLVARQDRLRKNIQTGSDDHRTAKWRDDLGRAEDHIEQLEEEHLPDLTVVRDQARRELYAALFELSVQWSE